MAPTPFSYNRKFQCRSDPQPFNSGSQRALPHGTTEARRTHDGSQLSKIAFQPRAIASSLSPRSPLRSLLRLFWESLFLPLRFIEDDIRLLARPRVYRLTLRLNPA